jgi:hypothetical protein
VKVLGETFSIWVRKIDAFTNDNTS